MRGVTIQDTASLAVAIAQLKLVDDLVSAIRTADIQSGKELGPGGIAVDPEPIYAPRDVYHPTPEIAPRVVYHPTPRYEPRPVLHPTEKIEPSLYAMPADLGTHHATTSPIQPPWKVLPYPQTLHSTSQVKAVVARPDTNHVGSLIDIFL